MQTQTETQQKPESSKSKPVKNKKKVIVVGLGYVGLPLALLADHRGCTVTGLDLDAERVERINQKKTPFTDKKIRLSLSESNLTATTDWASVEGTDVIVICVPTPLRENHRPDLKPVKSACEAVGKHLQKDQLIVLESTVNPGVSDEIVKPILEKASGLVAGKDFFLAHCPERINPGDSHWSVENIPRVVGGLNEESLRRATEFYRSIVKAPIKEMGSLKEAEAVKIVENSFRDINIALVNELAMSFSKLGIDVVNVIEGAATKPFAFMPHYPGSGVGGHCIPVDPYYLIDYAKANGFYHDFLSLARRINEHMPAFTVEQVDEALNERKIALKGSEIAVLGLAYKPNIDDIRESPSFEVIKLLQDKGANVRSFDPYVPERSSAKTLEMALRGAQAVVVATAHREFASLTPQDLSAYAIRIVIDGRNCLPKNEFKAAGIVYRGIGR
jgi:UDP-N-acetyl-D-glucosamine dehydrogenase